MNIKEAAEKVADALWYESNWVGSPEQDDDTGGWWFDVELGGKPYTILIKDQP